MTMALATPAEGDRRERGRTAVVALTILVAAVALASLAIGPAGVDATEVVRLTGDLLAGRDPAEARLGHVVLFDIRMPRTLLGLVVGGALGIAGAMMQGLFRNPLADPGIVGVSSGAALGAVAAITLGGGVTLPVLGALGIGLLPAAAFTGGLVTTVLLYLIATRQGRTSVATMLLAGIALGALAGAVTAYLIFRSDDLQLREFTFWSLGGLGGATWTKAVIAAVLCAGVFVAAPLIGRALDMLVLGEAEARHLGIEVDRMKRIIIVLVALAVGTSVAFAGVIGFVGIVVPHLLRLSIGPEHRLLLPASALLGGALLVTADMLCRILVAPAELPIGILTAVLGAPFFLWLLLRRRGLVDL
ncbi:FecCD family ABC transporter permease [Prosthecomicrobium pneumaticum]|uniref:Iron complex transport system permease protein n=1 Tax=Prosthecomicrobium pneumaticum TaxID=81895 RepID=A0A7W9L209_9HYPH|nr:iron ABC transporter permease [Prosthecomicrobium pneumaticum]MBB5753096.1 iron complex transport system permease protein [Prosthecomicrobium pneumaticum]